MKTDELKKLDTIIGKLEKLIGGTEDKRSRVRLARALGVLRDTYYEGL